ncbi:MAG: hypothetical protein ABR508_07455 [Candidatus Baltobacteraceae bacterium]
MKGAFVRLIPVATVLMTLVVMLGRGESAYAGPSDPAANTTIINSATATWSDSAGHSFEESSNQITVIVQGVSALTVTPKETAANPSLDGYPAAQNVTRTFVIENASNIADAYRISAFTADRGTLVSLAFVTSGGNVPITVGSTVSPTLQPGESITVQTVVSTAGIAVGTSFALHLTAQTTVTGTANGVQSDSGEQWLVAAAGPALSGPGGGSTPISKTVNREQVLQSQSGAIVTFDIVVKNNGGTPADNAVMTDTIPAGLTADLTTLKLNGVAVSGTQSGQTLTVPLGMLAAGAVDDVSFNSQIAAIDTLGTTFVNVAAIAADGIAPASTTPAAILIGTADIVFDPSNNNAPIAGATVSLLDQNSHLVPLGAGSNGAFRAKTFSAPQSANSQNPLLTGPDGTYGFALEPNQIGPGAGTFYITIQAPGYLNRRIKIVLTASTQGMLYDVTTSSQDGQPLAHAGGYALTTGAVALNNIFGLFGNLPMFKTQAITIDKVVDRTSAQPGDRLVYTLDVANPSGAPLIAAKAIDTLPSGESYAPGSARVDGVPREPAVNGRALTWNLSTIASGAKHQIVYAAIVYPNVPAGTTLTNSAVAQAVLSGTLVNVNAAANADVIITEGALSDRSVITGRVFADLMHTGRFVKGDRGLAGVRVFLEDGTSVTTDSQGRYSFPGVRPGMHVLRVDRTTLPDGANGTFQRLIHGVLDDGLMQDVEFAVGSP